MTRHTLIVLGVLAGIAATVAYVVGTKPSVNAMKQNAYYRGMADGIMGKEGQPWQS